MGLCPATERVPETDLHQPRPALTTRVEVLERRLAVSSETSHRPPSSDRRGVVRVVKAPTGRRRGGQAGHDGHQRASEAPSVVVATRPETCRGCGAPLDPAVAVAVDEHLVWEIPAPRAIVTSYQKTICRCLRCGTTTRAGRVVGEPVGAFGANLEAVIVALSTSERLSRRRLKVVLQELCGVTVGLGTIDRVLARAAIALTAAVSEIDEEITAAHAVNVDETGWRVAGKRHWVWLATTRHAVRIRIDEKRSRAALQRLSRRPRARSSRLTATAHTATSTQRNAKSVGVT